MILLDNVPMKALFYFDYSDYRSYFMMQALESIEPLPFDIQWVALDSYSLRALSGASAPGQVPLEREYLRKEALRLSALYGVRFTWQAEPIRSGTALQAAVWIMSRSPEAFKAYSRCILEGIWELGQHPDASFIRSTLESLGLSSEDFFHDMSDRSSFAFQDACLQEALAAGVFDVPTLIVGDTHLCRFESPRDIKRAILEEWLKHIPKDVIVQTFATLLFEQSDARLSEAISALSHALVTPSTAAVRRKQHAQSIILTTSAPKPIYPVPKKPIAAPIFCQFVTASDENGLLTAFGASLPGMITICVTPNLHYDGNGAMNAILANTFRDRREEILFFAHVIRDGVATILCVRCDSDGACDVQFPEDDGTWPLVSEKFKQGVVVALSSRASDDLLMARAADYMEAQIALRIENSSFAPLSEAFGVIASAWIIEFSSSGVSVVDIHARRKNIDSPQTLSLDNSHALEQVSVWAPPAPRTLLLLEKSITFGDVSSEADIELACRGVDLCIVTANQESNISHARDYVSIRIADSTFDILPISGDQLFTIELMLYRVICTMNRASQNSYPIFVNYWADLEFEMLDSIRPVLASVSSVFRVPILLVVANQLVEIWHANAAGMPYRLEKEGDAFQMDFADLLTNGQWADSLLTTLHIRAKTLTDRLEGMEILAKNL